MPPTLLWLALALGQDGTGSGSGAPAPTTPPAPVPTIATPTVPTQPTPAGDTPPEAPTTDAPPLTNPAPTTDVLAPPANPDVIPEAPALQLRPTPSPIKRVRPSGPTGASWFEQGDVTCAVSIQVDATGKPTELVAESTEDACPKPFMKASLRAMKWWRFLPAQEEGRPVAGTFRAEVTYTASGDVVGAD